MNSSPQTKHGSSTQKRRRKLVWSFLVTTPLVWVLLLWGATSNFEIFSQLLKFVDRVTAESSIIQPNANGTTGGTPIGCTGDLHYECVNDGVTQPTSPGTGSDYIQMVNIDQTFLRLDTFADVDTATSVTVWIYHRDQASNAFKTLALYAENETTVYAGPTTLASQTSAGWTAVTFSGLSLTQTQLDGLTVKLDCEKTGGGKSNECYTYAMYADVNFNRLIEVNVGTTGTQQNLDIGSTNAHVGGTFTITENVSSRNITGITIQESGTVNGQTGLDNIRLYYDLDTTTPFNCASESYSGTESQFGSTDTDGFSGANGTSAFTGSVAISTTAAMCVYVVLDVATSTLAGQTIEIDITNPSTNVVASGGADVRPLTTVSLGGTTVIQAQDRNQIHYHWRNDDGSETAATSATGGSEDTVLSALGINSPIRLRMGISNEGNRTSDATQYRLEYAQKVSTCNAATGWTDVGASDDDINMYDSANLTNGNDTTNVLEVNGGVTDENITFLTPNGGVRDTSSQTGSITLTSAQYVDLEYSIIASTTATAGNTYCFRVTNAGAAIETYSVYPEATILADITVSTEGTLRNTVDIPTTDVDAGANFVIIDNISGDTTIQSITLTASGTVNLQSDIDNIELRYDLDTSFPYNCVSETYNGTESLFGTTDTDGFSTASTSTFTGSQVVNPTQSMCIYVIYDVTSNVSDAEVIDIFLENAANDVGIDSGTIAPTALVDLPGETTFVNQVISQVHYHWRNDDGNETGASSATGGSEDTLLQELRRTTPTRLRVGIANLGGSTTPAYQYRLEFTLKTSVCSAATGWTDVGATDDEFNLYNSPNFTDGSNTTNIAVANGGVTDVGTTYLTSNGALKDTSSQTGSITLPGYNYVDLEYSLVASTTATEGATYCFRVTNAGTPIDDYDVYPEVSIKPRTDFFIQRGITTVTGTSATINAGTDYIAPSASTTAFIRIVGTNNIAAGSATSTGNADDVTAYISNPSNITNSITFSRPAAATGATRINWEIIEYVGAPGGDNEIVVRQQQIATYGTGNTTVTTPTVSGVVDDADVAVFITAQRNPDTATGYPLGLSTAAWNAGTDDATFTRGASGNAAGLSYAVVEFIGDNWKVQRAEHTYSAAGTTETASITAVNSLLRTFLHVQKRMGSGLNNHADFGHNVYLSGIGQVSFELESTAGTPGSHTSVAWVLENTQTIGDSMIVTRSNGSESGGVAPKTVTTSIGTTISDTRDASLFINNYGNEGNGTSNANSFPEPIINAEITSVTQYQNWVPEPDGDTRTWRAEVVEWPTAARDIEQNYFRFYVDNDTLTPTDPWPPGPTNLGDNFPITVDDEPLSNGSTTRLRMTLLISAASMDAGIDNFKLQYGEKTTTCSAIGEVDWHDLGEIGSTTALWRGVDGSPADGDELTTLNITAVSDVAGTYEEENPTAFTPNDANPGEDIEFDWHIQHNGAKDKTDYCFRMTEADGTLFDVYGDYYPTIRTAGFEPQLTNWRWYDDENNATPSFPMAAENVAPSNVIEGNAIKLRTVLKESSGAPGVDNKFVVQYSEYSDFSQGVYTVTSTTTCSGNSIWCYFDGAGEDNAVIDTTVISNADSCTAGVGDGCGTHNEGTSSTTATYDQPAFAATEYEFTLLHDGARVNTVYYFRLYDIVAEEVVAVADTFSVPSLVTEGAAVNVTSTGIGAGFSVAGIVADATTTPTSISFGRLPLGESYEAVQQISVDTNATEGYQMLLFTDQPLTNEFAATIPVVTGTNASPLGWTTACSGVATGCFGYHTTDATLAGGSARFAPIDSYAALSTTPEEVAYSSIPTSDSEYIVYRLQITETQAIGDYEANLTYIIVPVH